MDIRTHFIQEGSAPVADWVIAPPQLDTDDGLETAVIVSLFSDRRADPGDRLPDESGDRRGWWGDTYPDIEGDRIGSRLWLLQREKQLPEVLVRARHYASEALRWLIEDGIAQSIDVLADFPRLGTLFLQIDINRATAPPLRFRFETFWSASNVL